MGCEKSLNWIKERDEHCGCKFCKGEWNSSWDSLKWMFNFHSQFTPQPHTIVRSYWKVEIEKEMQEHNWDLLCLLNTAQLRKCDEWIRIRKKCNLKLISIAIFFFLAVKRWNLLMEALASLSASNWNWSFLLKHAWASLKLSRSEFQQFFNDISKPRAR